MDKLKKWKKNIITKTYERCKSGKYKTKPSDHNTLTKSKSWPAFHLSSPPPRMEPTVKGQVAPGGCFSVYVGPQKRRFVMKAKYANHPMFKMLLEEAELEYGYNSEGPIVLPCDVDLFYKVLEEIDSEKNDVIHQPRGCGGYASYTLLSPSKLLKMNQF